MLTKFFIHLSEDIRHCHVPSGYKLRDICHTIKKVQNEACFSSSSLSLALSLGQTSQSEQNVLTRDY